MFAAKYHLDNLTAIIDRNGMQVNGLSEQVMPVEPLPAKWRDFGWHVMEVDGHDLVGLQQGYEQAVAHKGEPTVLVAHTIKGHGVSFSEGQAQWHNRSLTQDEARLALAELGETA